MCNVLSQLCPPLNPTRLRSAQNSAQFNSKIKDMRTQHNQSQKETNSRATNAELDREAECILRSPLANPQYQPTMSDCLTALGLPEYSSRDEARTRYRRLSLAFHPDTTHLSRSKANDVCIIINRAWSVLQKDPNFQDGAKSSSNNSGNSSGGSSQSHGDGPFSQAPWRERRHRYWEEDIKIFNEALKIDRLSAFAFIQHLRVEVLGATPTLLRSVPFRSEPPFTTTLDALRLTRMLGEGRYKKDVQLRAASLVIELERRLSTELGRLDLSTPADRYLALSRLSGVEPHIITVGGTSSAKDQYFERMGFEFPMGKEHIFWKSSDPNTPRPATVRDFISLLHKDTAVQRLWMGHFLQVTGSDVPIRIGNPIAYTIAERPWGETSVFTFARDGIRLTSRGYTSAPGAETPDSKDGVEFPVGDKRIHLGLSPRLVRAAILSKKHGIYQLTIETNPALPSEIPHVYRYDILTNQVRDRQIVIPGLIILSNDLDKIGEPAPEIRASFK